MLFKSEKVTLAISGIIIGIISSVLVLLGNPANMGFCIACFLRDTAGALGLHQAAAVQYIRPEILGLVLGSMLMALCRKEFAARGGSSPITRFLLGFWVMIGCLMFLGCPFRTILRLAGGDLNALAGLVGFIFGILVGIFFLNRGYSLKRTYQLPASEGFLFPGIIVVLLLFAITVPAFIHTSQDGPGSKHAALLISLAAGLLVGIIAQFSRLCMVGGIRDFVLFRDYKLLFGFLGILVGALLCNLIFGKFYLGFADQPIAHTDAIWNALGMLLAGFGCVLLGGCPLRQLVLSGEGNSDSAITVLGLMIGAAFAHNFGLASSAAGPTTAGKIAVLLGLCMVAGIAALNTFSQKS